MVQMTLKEFIDHFQQDLNDPASTLVATKESICIIKEENETEINVSNGMIQIHERINLREFIG